MRAILRALSAVLVSSSLAMAGTGYRYGQSLDEVENAEINGATAPRNNASKSMRYGADGQLLFDFVLDPGTLPPTCTNYTESTTLVALYRMEEEPYINDTAAQCGTACDLGEDGTVTLDGTNFKEGSFSADFDGAGDRLSCTDANCGGTGSNRLDIGATDTMTIVGWVRVDGDTNDTIVIKAGGTNGYSVERNATLDQYQCQFGNGTTTVSRTRDNAFPADGNFHHFGCRRTSTGVRVCSDGTCLAGESALALGAANNTSNFAISRTAIEGLVGQADEIAVFKTDLSDAQYCQICSCGVDGTLCTDDGVGGYTDAGRNVADCNTCTLPACDSTPP